jgi:hypothetical protein
MATKNQSKHRKDDQYPSQAKAINDNQSGKKKIMDPSQLLKQKPRRHIFFAIRTPTRAAKVSDVESTAMK